MALNRQEMLDYARTWAAKRGVLMSPGSEASLAALFAAAEPRIRDRLGQIQSLTHRSSSGPVVLQIEGALETLLETMRAASPDGAFHEYSAGNALQMLGPGWWPFT